MDSLSITVLKYLLNRTNPLVMGKIREQLISIVHINKANDIIGTLANDNYIVIEDNKVSITDLGKSTLNEIEKSELDIIYNRVFDNFDDAVIEFMYNRNGYTKIQDFPQVLKDKAPVVNYNVNNGPLLETLFRLKPSVAEKGDWYILTDTGKAYYERVLNKPKTIHNNPLFAETLADLAAKLETIKKQPVTDNEHKPHTIITNNFTNNAPNSPMAFGDVKQENHSVSEPLKSKDKWYTPIMKEIEKRWWAYVFGAIILIAGYVINKQSNRQLNPKTEQVPKNLKVSK